jgi:photosystem II stability/assembly factor-like uncharacterized protein
MAVGTQSASAHVCVTSDGGATWQAIDTGLSGALANVLYMDLIKPVLAVSGGHVFATSFPVTGWSDEGDQNLSNSPLDMTKVGANYWMAGGAGTLQLTTDPFNPWSTKTTGCVGTTRAVGGFGNLVVAGCGGGEISYTSNTWSSNQMGFDPQSGNINALQMVSDTVGWAVGPAGAVIRTTDGAANWTLLNPGVGSVGLIGLHCRTAAHCWVAGAVGALAETTDGGSHWTNRSPGGGGTYIGPAERPLI